ncbi:type I polyketide synthase [Streptomyces sp. NBC_01530]|uniref:type I polyketide synthase n=1 Tax=Streptomyces sp. NBC_01530 TaxID=2903895 RepID=UPI00386B65D4
MDDAIHHPYSMAIVGMALRVPGASDVAGYWRNISGGVESISRFNREELAYSGIPAVLLDDPDYVPAKGVLDEADVFDAEFFSISPREGEMMDPQHRVFLETAWHALEDAGYDPDRLDVPVGVYAGSRMSQYAFNLYDQAKLHTDLDELPLLLGNDKDYLASRVSYQLGLRGPSVAVHTACSTSLVSVAMACDSLLTHQCDMVIAGGARVSLPLRAGYLYSEDSITSPDGHCRAFDAEAAGTVFGDGVGAVVLKRLEDALSDGDHIEAVIRGWAVNNDGRAKAGWTAPSLDAQAEVMSQALATAAVSPRSIGYVETHGTGTALGDPLEIAAMNQAYGARERNDCPIGSVKPNIGHLSAAAGIAGLIKAVLVIGHREIPPTINYRTPNPQIPFGMGPFFVNTEPRLWPDGDTPRRAGVSSFGMGGTNCHMILEEAPDAR